MYVILVSYRARGAQEFRRNEVLELIQNVRQYFAKKWTGIQDCHLLTKRRPEIQSRGIAKRRIFNKSEIVSSEQKVHSHECGL